MTTVTLSPAALTGKRLEVPLSKLTASRHNPRKVKAERDAHRRLVASIRAHGLLQPLVVQPHGEGRYAVIAGNRRLAALRELFKDAAAPVDPKIACILKQVTADEGLSAALAENFVREPMHPLDEAEAFAALAREEGQGAEEIASRFGVTPAFVRQRMKLAALADLLKNAYREGTIDTGMAEAFAAVPEDKQLAVWKELRGQPRHADQPPAQSLVFTILTIKRGGEGIGAQIFRPARHQQRHARGELCVTRQDLRQVLLFQFNRGQVDKTEEGGEENCEPCTLRGSGKAESRNERP